MPKAAPQRANACCCRCAFSQCCMCKVCYPAALGIHSASINSPATPFTRQADFHGLCQACMGYCCAPAHLGGMPHGCTRSAAGSSGMTHELHVVRNKPA